VTPEVLACVSLEVESGAIFDRRSVVSSSKSPRSAYGVSLADVVFLLSCLHFKFQYKSNGMKTLSNGVIDPKVALLHHIQSLLYRYMYNC